MGTKQIWLHKFWIAGMLIAFCSWAEETPKTETEKTTELIKRLEARIQTLEQAMVEKDVRLNELQKKLADAPKPLLDPDKPTGDGKEGQGGRPGLDRFPGFQFHLSPDDMQNLNRRLEGFFRKNLDDLFDPHEKNFDDDEDFGFSRPPRRGFRNPGPDPFHELERPKLGVQVQDATPELNGKYKNPAQDGAVLIEVMPGSVADQAGLKVGDCVISFDQVPVRSAQELVGHVRAASDGKHKLAVLREGKEMAFSFQLKAKEDPPKETGRAGRERARDPWIKKKNEEVVEIQTNALKMNDELAKSLNLDEKQKKGMEEILAKHAAALSKEYAERTAGPARRAQPLTHEALEGMVRRQVEEAEADLKTMLSENQIQTWREYRNRNKELSISRRLKIEEGGRDESQGF